MSHQLETIIGYKFKNPELLETALTHTSYANESRTPVKHNERLEFLGDSVLQIVSADYLFHAYADRPEGDLTRIRASLVSESALFQFAQEIDLGEYLRLGRGEERCGGRTRPSVVSDAFEAVIAALYLDGGMEVARKFILPFSTEGVDFVMTAMFTVIFLNQWEKDQQHGSALIGLAVPLVCLIVFGSGSFLLPSMAGILVLLLALRRPMEKAAGEVEE